MSESMDRPRTPGGLGTKGRKLWSATLDEFILRADELVMLEQAARTADLIEGLRGALDAGGLVVPGSTGQARVNPLVGEIRAQRLAFGRLVSALGLPSQDPADQSARPWSRRAQKAAATRWMVVAGGAAS